MGEFTLFADLLAMVTEPLLTALQAKIGGMMGTARALSIVVAVVAAGLQWIEVSYQGKNFQTAMREFFMIALACALVAGADVYTQYVTELFVHIIPGTISTALGLPANPAHGIDVILVRAFKAGAQVYNSLPSYSLKIIPLGIAIIAFLVLSVATTAYTFLVYVLSLVTVVVACLIGPLFIALGAWEFLRKYTWGWLSVLVGAVTAQAICLTILLLLSTAEAQTLTQMSATVIAADDTVGEIWMIGKVGALMFLCYAMIKQSWAIASAIAGGVHHHISSASAMTFGVAGAAGAIAGRAAGAGATAAAAPAVRSAAAAMRSIRPAGPSLSRATP